MYATHRITIPGVIHAFAEQTNGLLQMEDFFPLPCPNPECVSLTYLLRLDDGSHLPFPRFVEVRRYLGAFRQSATLESNRELENSLHEVIKQESPSCEVGLRAWREPPLEKSKEYLRHCRDSIPKDVCLFWAPGLYVPESEFSKWVKVFGPERICARDTESNAWSSTQGRLIRIFKSKTLVRASMRFYPHFRDPDHG